MILLTAYNNFRDQILRKFQSIHLIIINIKRNANQESKTKHYNNSTHVNRIEKSDWEPTLRNNHDMIFFIKINKILKWLIILAIDGMNIIIINIKEIKKMVD